MADKTYRLLITEWVTLIGVFIACFLFLLSEMKGIESRIDQRMSAQEQRTDRLYEMFIDLIKAQCKKGDE